MAAIIQMTGPEAEEPCTRCKKDYAGVWTLCIRPPCKFIDDKVHGACANCVFRGRAADCSQSRKWKLADQSGMLSKATISETTTRWADEVEEIASTLSDPAARGRLASLAASLRLGVFNPGPTPNAEADTGPADSEPGSNDQAHSAPGASEEALPCGCQN